MKLYVSEPEPRNSGAILVCDEDSNDIAEFFHEEHATVPTSYETALDLVLKLVNAGHRAEELKAAYGRIARLEADLTECLEYFQDRYDVVDGSYGEPAPNKEMQLGTMLDETLNGRLR